MEKSGNITLNGKHERPIVADVTFIPGEGKKPVLIFCHGYKGFKDWGAWNLMAESFARNGFFFMKFNFAFNGGTLEEPIDFPDLKAFGENTFTKELDDLQVVLDWLEAPENKFSAEFNPTQISLMGHSRGGGTVILKAAEDSRVKRLITLASVNDFAARFPQGEEFEAWKKAGIGYIQNARTGQQMPHLFSFYEDFKANEKRFTISRAAKSLDIPFLIVHGTEDPTVDVSSGYALKDWNPNAKLLIMEGENHVFGASHPWEKEDLPNGLKQIIEEVTAFLAYSGEKVG